MTGHERIDQRSIAMHRAIAEKLLANPGLLNVAKENLERWMPTSGRSRPYMDAWREILSMPLEDIARMIQEDTERMRALRQCSPFAGSLTPRERGDIYDAFAVRAHHSSSGSDR
ncbi:MAG: hypothetical protein HY820_13215 [Acidobacteria bacterium]|nr:hypothetical protein [Acidobacteriota bacterium]